MVIFISLWSTRRVRASFFLVLVLFSSVPYEALFSNSRHQRRRKSLMPPSIKPNKGFELSGRFLSMSSSSPAIYYTNGQNSCRLLRLIWFFYLLLMIIRVPMACLLAWMRFRVHIRRARNRVSQ